jgi:hypothetical protein
MKETAKILFDSMRAAKDAGLHTVGKVLEATGPERSRLGTQGAMELASALFNNHGFVPYGPGQYTPSQDHQPQQEQQRGLER